LSDIQKNRIATEKEREEAERARNEIEKIKEMSIESRRKIEKEKETIINQARQEARRILLDAKREADEIMDKLKELEKNYRQAVQEHEIISIKHNIRQKVNELEQQLSESVLPRKGFADPPKDLKPGDSVMILNLNRKGTVLDTPDKDGQVQIQAGIMKIKMHISQLRYVDEQKDVVDSIGSSGYTRIKTVSICPEIDVRGNNIEEATVKLDKYIDEAVVAGLHEVSIIHGKGTGALRKGIHEFLRSHAHVLSFRLGKYGEGETGVTIVKLR
jgi:DNA mismatch repair protein MutS2